MEESIKGFDSYIRSFFQIPDVDINTYSPLTLAYIGDGIYDLVIRTLVVGAGNTRASRLHRETSRVVKAPAQSAAMEVIEPLLTEEEHRIYLRGRNAKSATAAKNASIAEYRRATGFEALMGYLYLTDRTERMLELMELAWKETRNG